MDNNYIVKKSNTLIYASYDLSLQEQKIVLSIASTVSPDDDDFKEYEFKIKDFNDLVEIKNKNSYTELKQSTKNLMRKPFEIKEEGKTIQVNWFSSITYKDGEGLIIFKFDSALKPYMLHLKELFTSYKLGNVLSLKSKYSIRLYEIMKSYEFRNEWVIDLEEFKSLVGASEKSYSVYQNVKNKIIIQAQKELAEKTDIRFDFEEIKKGRKVGTLKFKIRKNKPHFNSLENADKVDSSPVENGSKVEVESQLESNLEPLRAIMDKSITNLEIKKIYDAGKGNLEKIIKIYYYAKDKEVDNLVGYVIKILKDGFNEPKKNVPKSKKDFTERDYDYDDLERKLLGWDK